MAFDFMSFPKIFQSYQYDYEGYERLCALKCHLGRHRILPTAGFKQGPWSMCEQQQV